MKTIRTFLALALMLVAGTSATFAQAYTQSSYYNPATSNPATSTTTVTYTPRRSDNWWGSNVYEEQYYGLRIGPAFTCVNSDNPELNGESMKTGLNIGFIYGHELTDEAPLYIETGLHYVEKGGKGVIETPSESGNYLVSNKVKYNLNYFQLPILVKYIYDIDGNFSIQPFGGAYMALGLSGKIKDYGQRLARNSFGSRSDQFGRFDGGLKLGCGFGFDFFYGEIAYEIGLTNISHDDFDSSHSSALSISIGVNF